MEICRKPIFQHPGLATSPHEWNSCEDGEDVAVETLIDDSKGSEVERWERVGSGEVTVS